MKSSILLFGLLLALAFSHSEELKQGGHMHVSVKFLHQEVHTGWLPLPTNLLPRFMKNSAISIPLSLSAMKYNRQKPIKMSFELSDLNRQTTWMTIYDGRGVLAKTIELHIKVKNNNVMWIDEHVDYYPSIFHSNTKLPDSIGVSIVWHSENVFDSLKGFPTMLFLSTALTVFIVLGMVVIYYKDLQMEVMSQQFKQPKAQKTD